MPTIAKQPWVILLAGGDGSRLRDFTMHDGVSVPKQFCSLRGGPTLLQESLHRATSITVRQHIYASVIDKHRRWWQSQLWSLPSENIFAQPIDRGIAYGILLPLLHILQRDRNARVVVLPSDHYVRDEEGLVQSIREASTYAQSDRTHSLLLGMPPDGPDRDHRYIMPGMGAFHPADVVKLAEAPSASFAELLIDHGAQWNSHIVVAHVVALLEAFEARVPRLVAQLHRVVQKRSASEQEELISIYRSFPSLDFARHILAAQEHRLRLWGVPPCGWNELGTPEQLEATLDRVPATAHRIGFVNTTPHFHMVPRAAELRPTSRWLDRQQFDRRG